MATFTIDEHISHVEKWLVTGELDETILEKQFPKLTPIEKMLF